MKDKARHDDLAAALDFSVSDDGATVSDLDALDVYAIPGAALDDPQDPVFTVANPDGSVTVTAASDGRVTQIELSPKATAMTEADLADEIVVVAGLATQDAKSAQYAYMLEAMRQQGHDDAATRDFLTRDLDLPTPEQVAAERTRIFAARHAGGHD
ncbi:YbaB/EbfC family DNA-binding protein [Mycolicibacterium pulveris]|uniref:YbaB/EbfC family DNA-binding protein n=1 Tax=Mycolicibacterium pulveris TaxID=36813 RepID=UPI003CF543C8